MVAIWLPAPMIPLTAGGAPEWWQLTLVAIGTVLTYDGRVHPALVIAIGVVAGVALGR